MEKLMSFHSTVRTWKSDICKEEFFLGSNPNFICNLYIYIQQIGVRIGYNGLGKGTH
jgi:hypothetical protein